MTVQQLIQRLAGYPLDAVVLLEGDAGYSPVGEISQVSSGQGMPDEVVISPDMTPD
jgi:hypothetical protein